jgi:hypothetical protein
MLYIKRDPIYANSNTNKEYMFIFNNSSADSKNTRIYNAEFYLGINPSGNG